MTETTLSPTPSSLRVRAVREGDKPRWSELFREYIAWYKADVADEVIELTWQRLIQGGEGNHQGLLAEDADGLVIGLAHVLLHRSTWSPTHYCYLEDLYVDSKARAQGIGQALIEAVYKLADDQGATKTYWQTQEINYRARGLYDKLTGKPSGFIVYERPKQ